jgi:hypothetical protein
MYVRLIIFDPQTLLDDPQASLDFLDSLFQLRDPVLGLRCAQEHHFRHVAALTAII